MVHSSCQRRGGEGAARADLQSTPPVLGGRLNFEFRLSTSAFIARRRTIWGDREIPAAAAVCRQEKNALYLAYTYLMTNNKYHSSSRHHHNNSNNNGSSDPKHRPRLSV